MIVFHGSKEVVEHPEIRITKIFTLDFIVRCMRSKLLGGQ